MRHSTLALIGLLASTALATPGLAQDSSIGAFPIRQYVDENGVDLLSGLFTGHTPTIGIGDAEMGLAYGRVIRGGLFRDTILGTISVSGSTYTVGIGGQSEAFTLSGTTFTPVEQNGSSLSLSGSTYTYTRADGTIATFEGGTYGFGNGRAISMMSLVSPSGRSLSFHYTTVSYTTSSGTVRSGRRLQSVTTNAGYHMKLSYASDTVATSSEESIWARLVKVKALNSSVDTCSVTAFSCPQTGRPELTIATPSTGTYAYADAEGRTTTYTTIFMGPGQGRPVNSVRLPGSSSNDISITYLTGSMVQSITRFGVTTGYAFADSGNVRTVTVTRPGGSTRVVTFDVAKSVMLSDTNELGKTTSYQYDSNNRPTRVTLPEGNYTQLTYDTRGNVTETRQVSKTPGTPPDIVSTADYPVSCTNGITCNKPNSITDARGNTTDYTWDTTHGGLLTVTAPAPSGSGNRPEARISYTKLEASGSPSATGIFVQTGTSSCQTGTAPSCAGTADEVKSTIAYGYGLQPSSITTGAGDNSLIATQAMTYDPVGNLLTIDGPLTGTDDITRYHYNLNRELVGVVEPDPDGGGILKHRATRITFGATGLVTKAERGTVVSQSDPDWMNFVSLEEVQQEYDSNRRVSVGKLVAGGTIHALSQTSYDSRGRMDCVAARMNPAVFGSLPSSACSLGTQGSHGPDRITKQVYDAASQVTQVQVAVGTSDAATERTLTYTSNGMLATLKDAENNLTTYEYDGHDRLSKTRFPVTTQGANQSSTTDYEQLTYENVSWGGQTRTSVTVASFRNRANETIGFSYDNLARMTAKDLPGTEPDVSYGYDLFGRLTSATQTGNSLSFTYDALGRNLTQVGPQGTVTSEWDVAGRRTRLTYPGTGLYVDYDHLVTGEVTKIRENGATSGVGVLATYAYDNFRRRTSLTFGNGVVQAFAFDPVSRLASLTNDLSGTANDLSATFSYNPASQIASSTRTGDTYAWTGHFNQNISSIVNGLNQIANYGAKSVSHDAKGNITAFGTKSFTYSSENLLLTGPASTTLAYDPVMRLRQTVSGAATLRFAYDGLDRIAEYNGSDVLQRRYVHGPAIDEPLVWYEGSGTSDRRFLSSDERGSIVSVTDSSGGLLGINRYDEFGQPQSTNLGIWGYTGQAWLPNLDLWYYKARIYESEAGHFVQTDPIGYVSGPNLYAYVNNDPINFIDPMGLSPNSPDDEEENPTQPSAGSSYGNDVVVTAYRMVRVTFISAAGVGVNVFVNINEARKYPRRIGDYVEEMRDVVGNRLIRIVFKQVESKPFPTAPKLKWENKSLDTRFENLQMYLRAESVKRLEDIRGLWGNIGRIMRRFEGDDN